MHTVELKDFHDWKAEHILASANTAERGRKQLLVSVHIDVDTADTWNMYRVNVKDSDGVYVGSYGSTEFKVAIETYNKF